MSVWKSDETLLSICILNFSFKNDFVWEEISNIRHSVSSPDETPRSSSKILRCASYFQLSSQCFIWWWNTASHVWYITSGMVFVELLCSLFLQDPSLVIARLNSHMSRSGLRRRLKRSLRWKNVFILFLWCFCCFSIEPHTLDSPFALRPSCLLCHSRGGMQHASWNPFPLFY